jgi:hypothetical protein
MVRAGDRELVLGELGHDAGVALQPVGADVVGELLDLRDILGRHPRRRVGAVVLHAGELVRRVAGAAWPVDSERHHGPQLVLAAGLLAVRAALELVLAVVGEAVHPDGDGLDL